MKEVIDLTQDESDFQSSSRRSPIRPRRKVMVDLTQDDSDTPSSLVRPRRKVMVDLTQDDADPPSGNRKSPNRSRESSGTLPEARDQVKLAKIRPWTQDLNERNLVDSLPALMTALETLLSLWNQNDEAFLKGFLKTANGLRRDEDGSGSVQELRHKILLTYPHRNLPDFIEGMDIYDREPYIDRLPHLVFKYKDSTGKYRLASFSSLQIQGDKIRNLATMDIIPKESFGDIIEHLAILETIAAEWLPLRPHRYHMQKYIDRVKRYYAENTLDPVSKLRVDMFLHVVFLFLLVALSYIFRGGSYPHIAASSLVFLTVFSFACRISLEFQENFGEFPAVDPVKNAITLALYLIGSLAISHLTSSMFTPGSTMSLVNSFISPAMSILMAQKLKRSLVGGTVLVGDARLARLLEHHLANTTACTK